MGWVVGGGIWWVDWPSLTDSHHSSDLSFPSVSLPPLRTQTPTAYHQVMALLGAFVYTAFQDAVASQALAAATGKRRRGAPPPAVVGGVEEWM